MTSYCSNFLVVFGVASGYIRPYKSNVANIQELILLINLTLLYGVAVCYRNYTDDVVFSITAIASCTSVLYHFITYTCNCNIMIKLLAIKGKLKTLCCNEKQSNFNDMQLLNIPDCTFNYSEYREGLVSDDFNN